MLPYFGKLDFRPQVNFEEVISDTMRWISIRGKFKATSKSSYLLIGNFFDEAGTKKQVIQTNRQSREHPVVFILIDDVYVGEKEPFPN